MAGKKGQTLTDKQQRFVSEYLVDLNATQACIRAGYSARNADKIGSQLLGNTRVAAAIAVEKRARSKRTEITQDWVIRRLRREAKLDGEGASHAARVSALKLLGQHLGMFIERHEHSGTLQHDVNARLSEFRSRYGTSQDAAAPAGADGGAQPVRPATADAAADQVPRAGMP